VLLSRRGDYRLAGGRVKDAWRRRCAAGLRPVLDPVGSARASLESASRITWRWAGVTSDQDRLDGARGGPLRRRPRSRH